MREFDFEMHVNSSLKKALLVLAAFTVYVFLDKPNPVSMGFIVGAGVSIINAYFLARRIRIMALLARIDQGKAKAFLMFGSVTRWGLIFGVLLFAVYTGRFDLLAMLGGFMLHPAIAVAGVLRALVRQSLRVKYNA